MRPTLREKLNYRFERFLSKGGSAIFISLLVVFVGGFILLISLRFLLLYFFPDLEYNGKGFLYEIWLIFLQMTDPGNMNQDNLSPTWLKITTVLAGVIGVILLSMLIAFITTFLEGMLYEFRKGRGKIIESDHTLILGWNERVVDIIRELILANESEKRASVVVLSTEDKEMMDDMIAKRLPDTKTTAIITTTGDYANVNELKRVNVTDVKSIIILANCSESAKEEVKMLSDIQSIKSIMAIHSCQGEVNELPIIVEIFNDSKRELISYFNDDSIIAIDSWEIMGKLLVQTSLTSGLEMVYNEILSFDGGEMYFYEPENWNNTNFYELPFHFKDGVPIGVFNEEEGLVLRPPEDKHMEKGDQVLILAEDDSTIDFQVEKFISPIVKTMPDRRLAQVEKKILFLGWHSVAEIFICESHDYLLEGSQFDIMIQEPNEELNEKVKWLKEEYPNFNINLIQEDTMVLDSLAARNPFSYNNIIILSQELKDSTPDKIDSDTLIILLLLRKLKPEHDDIKTKIITQVLNSENQEIITQTDVDDFIISNKLITMILAQLSEEPQIKTMYDDIFYEEGSEIYVKPANLYFDDFPQKMRFADAIGHCFQREEICIGIRKGNLGKDHDANFGVKLNLPKDEMIEIQADDFFVVLSEDEL